MNNTLHFWVHIWFNYEIMQHCGFLCFLLELIAMEVWSEAVLV